MENEIDSPISNFSNMSLHQQEESMGSGRQLALCNTAAGTNNSMSTSTTEYFDIILLCSSYAKQEQKWFLNFCARNQFKVYLPCKEKIVGEDVFMAFERGYAVSSFVVILLTPCFTNDVWTVKRYQTALKKAIENNQTNIIPVFCGIKPENVPFELTSISSVSYDDEYFELMMKKAINISVREEQQKKFSSSSEQDLKREHKVVTSDDGKDIDELDYESLETMSYAAAFNETDNARTPNQHSATFINYKQFQDLCMKMDILSPSVDGDWRGFAVKLGLTSNQIYSLEDDAKKVDFSPSKRLLDLYFSKRGYHERALVLKDLKKIFMDMNYGPGLKVLEEI